MTIALDTSGWLARFLDGPFHQHAIGALSAHEHWCASALVLPEAVVALGRLGLDAHRTAQTERAMRADWAMVHVVPLDASICDHAAALAAEHYLRLADAIHLASAVRLPRPVTYLTFDPAQIPAAIELDLQVSSPVTTETPSPQWSPEQQLSR